MLETEGCVCEWGTTHSTDFLPYKHDALSSASDPSTAPGKVPKINKIDTHPMRVGRGTILSDGVAVVLEDSWEICSLDLGCKASQPQ